MSQRQSGAIRNIAEQCEELRQKINLLGESNSQGIYQYSNRHAPLTS